MIKIMGGEELSLRWHECAPLVEKALAHGTGDITLYDIFIECLAATSQCWVEKDDDKIVGVAITRVLHHKQYTELVIVCTTCEDWFIKGPEVLEMIEDFARGYGCKYTSVYGRRGWLRVLKKYGYYEPYINLKKEL